MRPQRGHVYRTYRWSDVVFRLGVAFAVGWVYLRTLLVVPAGVDPWFWDLFAWTGWPFVLAVWAAAISTTLAWARER
jgi:hypothetical protein